MGTFRWARLGLRALLAGPERGAETGRVDWRVLYGKRPARSVGRPPRVELERLPETLVMLPDVTDPARPLSLRRRLTRRAGADTSATGTAW